MGAVDDEGWHVEKKPSAAPFTLICFQGLQLQLYKVVATTLRHDRDTHSLRYVYAVLDEMSEL